MQVSIALKDRDYAFTADPGERQKEVEAIHRSFPAVRLMRGFVHEVAAVRLPPSTPGTIAFLAGPPPMIDASLRHLIMHARIPPARIRYDKFSLPTRIAFPIEESP